MATVWGDNVGLIQMLNYLSVSSHSFISCAFREVVFFLESREHMAAQVKTSCGRLGWPIKVYLAEKTASCMASLCLKTLCGISNLHVLVHKVNNFNNRIGNLLPGVVLLLLHHMPGHMCHNV